MLRFRDRDSYAGNKTKEYDDLAMKYLSYVLFLLVGCSAVYSLMYERHKSWYSWILTSLTSCVYMFGKPPFPSIPSLILYFCLKPSQQIEIFCFMEQELEMSFFISSFLILIAITGFIMMCPQLFINYKLKSVAHLPWRQMTYKFLNTIIDDLFAFVIKMPMLHRLSVFRDGEI